MTGLSAVPRMGLPWRLSHYLPMNGPQPLVCSFVEGYAAIRPLMMETSNAVPSYAIWAEIAQRVQSQALEHLEVFLKWIDPVEQAAVEARADGVDALVLHTTPSTPVRSPGSSVPRA